MTSKKLLWIFGCNQTFHWLIVGLLIPVLTLLRLEKGLNLFQIGITQAFYSGTVLLLELPTGGMADAIGRKRVYLISLFMLLFSGITLLVAWDFLTMSLGFAFMGVASALSSGSLDAWFVDEFHRIEPDGNLQQALARIGVCIPAGLGIGTCIGGFLPMSLGKITAQVLGSDIYSANLLLFSALIVVQFFLTVTLIHEEISPVQTSDVLSGFKQFPEIISTSLRYGMTTPIIWMLLVAKAGAGVGISGLELLWQPQVKEILGANFHPWLFGIVGIGFFFSNSLGNAFATPVCQRFHDNYRRVLVGIRLVMGIGLFLLAFQGTLTRFAICSWMIFMFSGMGKSPHAALFNAQIPSKERSTFLSVQSLFFRIGTLSGTLVMGYIANLVSIPVAWFLGAEILIISSLVYVCLSEGKGMSMP